MPEIIVKLGDNIVQKYFFVKEPISVGRTEDNQIVIENLAVSRNHARIDYDGEQYTIEDLGSSNGTFVNGVRIRKTEVIDRDVISIGKHKLFFYNQHATNNVRRPVIDAADRTMLMDMTPVPCLTVTKGRQKGQTIDLNRMPCTIGRSASNVLRINDWFVSKQHAIIEQQGDDYVIRDMDSWRNTRINGEIIKEAVLKPGDEIQLGTTVTMTFDYSESACEADPELRQPVEIEAGEDAFAEEFVGSTADSPQIVDSDPEIEAPLEPQESITDTGAELDAAILAEALGTAYEGNGNGNGVGEANGTESAEEISTDGDPFAEALMDDAPFDEAEQDEFIREKIISTEETDDQTDGEPLINQMIRAAMELESSGNDFGENSCPEPQNLESFIGSEPDKCPDDESDPFSGNAEPVGVAVTTGDDALASDIAMWEKALGNKSPVIRKQALRQLKKLTGRDYEY